MTYPQYQPPAQPTYGAPAAPATYPPGPSVQSGHGVPPSPYGAPYGPGYQPQSAPPAAPQPPSQGQAIAPPMPQLRDGGSTGGQVAPKARHLLDRTIIVEPVRMQRTKNPEAGNAEVDEAVFHLTVVDGGPLQYGDNQSRDPQKQRPNTHEIDTPCRFTNVTDIGYGFVTAVRDALDAGEPGRVGVVQRGTKGNFPYLITKCGVDVHSNERPDGQARYNAAMDLFGKIWHDKHAGPNAPKQFVSPEPRSLVAPPPAHAAAPAVNYGAPAAAPAQPAYNPYPTQPQYAADPQPGPGAPGYGYTPPQSASPAAGVAPNGFYMPGQGGYAAPTPPAAAEPPVPPHVEAWLATLPPEQQAGSRAQYLASQIGQQPTAAPAGPGI